MHTYLLIIPVEFLAELLKFRLPYRHQIAIKVVDAF